MQATHFGPLLRQWRQSRRMSQERLGLESEVSARHISFIENGKSQPSRTMVLVLASTLDLPLRERNVLLSAAGYAPVYRESGLDPAEMGPLRRILELILAQQEPYPALVVTPRWDLVQMNEAAGRVFAHFLEPPIEPIVATNVMHALFHPRGLRAFVVNWDEVSGTLLDRLRREAMIAPESGELRELLEALEAYPGPAAASREPSVGSSPEVCIAVHLKKGPRELRLFTTLTTLGTPIDVTAQELRIESYFPADDATECWLREGAG